MYKKFFTSERVRAAVRTFVEAYTDDEVNFRAFAYEIVFNYANPEIKEVEDIFKNIQKMKVQVLFFEEVEVAFCTKFIDRVGKELLQADLRSLKLKGKVFVQEDVDKLCRTLRDFLIENRPKTP